MARPVSESIVQESETWDRLSLEKLIEQSEPLDAVIVDRRKPKQTISMRVDPELIVAAKRIANQLGLGYQTLFRVWLMEGLSRYYREKLAEGPPRASRRAPRRS